MHYYNRENLNQIKELMKSPGLVINGKSGLSSTLTNSEGVLEILVNMADKYIQSEEYIQMLNKPELDNFQKAVVSEAKHQIIRWGESHDKNKSPADWFQLVFYLMGKASKAQYDGDTDKLKHHIITTAAALNNFHSQVLEKSK